MGNVANAFSINEFLNVPSIPPIRSAKVSNLFGTVIKSVAAGPVLIVTLSTGELPKERGVNSFESLAVGKATPV